MSCLRPLLSACCLATAIAVVVAAEVPRATAEHGGFAFPDRAGTRLMLLGESSRGTTGDTFPPFPEMLKATGTIRTALCAGGVSHPIEFNGRQMGDGKDNGRQYSQQFEHLDGLVFGFRDGARLPESEPCFLATVPFARTLSVIPITPVARGGWPPESTPCAAGLAKDVAARRQRPVTHCWLLATPPTSGGPQLVLLEFARQGNDALAAVALVDGGVSVYVDLPGKYDREGGGSVWRVSDGGVIQPDVFRIVFVAKRAGAYVLALSWAGDEGSSLTLFESRGDRFSEILHEYWYQMAM